MTGMPPQALLSDLVERVNAAWSILDICLVSFFFYYLYTHRDLIRHWWNRDTPLALQAAAAILVFHSGDSVVRTILWWLRHEVNRGDTSINSYLMVSWVTEVLEFAAFIACIGILCKIRVFAGPWLGRWVWLSSALLAVAAATLTRSLPF